MGKQNILSKDILEKAIDYIDEDRLLSNQMLEKLYEEITKGSEKYQSVGHVVTKLIDSKQRTADQLTKIAALLQKQEIEPDDEDSLDNIFEELDQQKVVQKEKS